MPEARCTIAVRGCFANLFQDRAIRYRVDNGFDNPGDYFVQRLSEGISTIAAAFYPKPVIVRLSDFKTNEYACLPGGQWFEPEEANPMPGFEEHLDNAAHQK